MTYGQNSYQWRIKKNKVMTVKTGSFVVFDELYIPCLVDNKITLWIVDSDKTAVSLDRDDLSKTFEIDCRLYDRIFNHRFQIVNDRYNNQDTIKPTAY